MGSHFLLNSHSTFLQQSLWCSFFHSETPHTDKMSDRYSGTNRDGNNYTSYGGSRGNYSYSNADGGKYYNAGQNQGSFYRNSDKGYQWYQNSAGERSTNPAAKGLVVKAARVAKVAKAPKAARGVMADSASEDPSPSRCKRRRFLKLFNESPFPRRRHSFLSLKICRSDLSVTIILLIIKEVTIMIQRKLIQRHSSRS